MTTTPSPPNDPSGADELSGETLEADQVTGYPGQFLGPSIPSRDRVSPDRVSAAIDTLGDLAGEDHPELDPATRDDLGHLRFVLEQILERIQS